MPKHGAPMLPEAAPHNDEEQCQEAEILWQPVERDS